MFKLVTSNAGSLQQGVGHRESGPTLLLEKSSADRSSQLDWSSTIDRIDPRVTEWLKNQKLNFDRYVYCLVVPLGSDESWEQTTNGDAFKREMLAPENKDWGHQSFMHHANAFRNHRNHNPVLGFGDVPFTCFNDEMDRVEGIWRLDRERAGKVGCTDIVDRVATKGAAEISMGCRVPYDVCSYCGNQAKTVKQYCSHVRNPGFGSINAAGELMRVFNPWPKFFDLSDVRVPAAPEAHVMMLVSPEIAEAMRAKTSSGARFIVPSSMLAAERWGMTESGLSVPAHYKASSAAEPVKLSDIVKRAPVLDAQVIRPLQQDEPLITKEVLKSSGLAGLPLPSVLSSLAALGIVCSPEEVCNVVESCTGEPKGVPATLEINRAWESAADDHPHLDSGFFSPVVADQMRKMVPDRSILFPHLPSRIAAYDVNERIGVGTGENGTSPDLHVEAVVMGKGEMTGMARYIASYLRTMAAQLGKLLAEVMATHPSHAEHCLGGGLLTAPPGSENATGMGGPPAAVAFPSSYILARAGMASDQTELQRSIDALHQPGIEHLFGGLLAP